MILDVVGIDKPCMDCLIHLSHLPKPNESIGVQQNSWQSGGKVATALVALARLGAKCGIIGDVGTDSYGEFCKNDLLIHGVDTSRLISHKGKRTTLAFVLSDEQTNGRNILGHGGNCPNSPLCEQDKLFIKSAKFLHLCTAIDRGLEAAKYAKANGVCVSYDGDSYDVQIEEILPYIDVFIGSEFFYEGYAEHHQLPTQSKEQNCGEILKRGCKICVYTFGAKGCVVKNKNDYFEMPAKQVKVVDTVGAGDTFHGAFIFGLLQDWDIKQIALFANAVASIKCMTIGGRAGIPDLPTAIEFINTGKLINTDIPARVQKYSNFPLPQ